MSGRYISRMQLVLSLQQQYSEYYGTTPFVIQKDGKDVYDMTHDLLTFTCCGNIEHKFTMTPMQMLMLKKKYGPQPCVWCRAEGVQINKNHEIGEDPDMDMMVMKNFIESSNSQDNLERKRAREEYIKQQQEKVKFKVNTDSYEEGDIIVSSKNIDRYMQEHPDYKPQEIVGDSGNRFNKPIDNPFSKRKKEFQKPAGVKEELPEIKSDVSDEEYETLVSLGLAAPKPKDAVLQKSNQDLKNILSNRETGSNNYDEDEEE